MSTLLLLLLAPFSLAGEISCSLNSYYSFLNVSWDEAHVTVRVDTPRGYSSMPQFEAPLAPEFFYLLERQAKSLEDLGKSFTYQWPKKACEFSPTDPWLIACFGASQSIGGEKEPKARAFTTALIEEKSLSAEQKVFRARFIFEKESTFFTAIPFPREKCRLNN